MRRVVVLRPEPGASETVARARKLGLDAVAIPLFEVEAVDWSAPEAGGFDGLLLTSANAVRHGGQQLHGLRGLPVYAVGKATGEAAREAGFDVKSVGDAGVDRLLDSIEPDLKLLHLCGEDWKVPEQASQDITAVPVYRSYALPELDLGAVGDSVVLIHSPRAGRRLAELVDDRRTIAIAAISEGAAEAAGEGWRAVEAAEKPDDEALLALAARLCNKPPRQ